MTSYYFNQWRIEDKKKQAIRMMIFFYLCFTEIIVQNIIIIWTSFYFYVGFGVASTILNIIAWNLLFKKVEPHRCSYLQLIEVFKGLVLIVLIIGDIKRSTWTAGDMFYFGFVQIAACFLVILLSSIFIAQELFRDETPSKSKTQKSMKQSFLK